MKSQNIFSDISVKKVSEKFEIDAYADDMHELERYVEFKSKSLGGDVTKAEVFNKMIRSLRFDLDYAAHVAPDMVKPKTVKKEKLLKRETEAPVS